MGACISTVYSTRSHPRASLQVAPSAFALVSQTQKRAADVLRPYVTPGLVDDHYSFIEGGTLGSGCAARQRVSAPQTPVSRPRRFTPAPSAPASATRPTRLMASMPWFSTASTVGSCARGWPGVAGGAAGHGA